METYGVVLDLEARLLMFKANHCTHSGALPNYSPSTPIMKLSEAMPYLQPLPIEPIPESLPVALPKPQIVESILKRPVSPAAAGVWQPIRSLIDEPPFTLPDPEPVSIKIIGAVGFLVNYKNNYYF